MSKRQYVSKTRPTARRIMHENEENEAMMETIPLTPTAPPLHLLFDDEGHLVDPNLTITSPPKQPRRHPAPFQDASVDQTSTTPIMTTTEAPSHDTTRLPRNSNSTTRSSTSSLNLTVSTTRQSDPLSRVPSDGSVLFGEGISFDHDDQQSMVSNVHDSQLHRFSFDVESGLLLNNERNYENNSGARQMLSPSQESEERRHVTSMIYHWGSRLNRELIRSSHVTSNELANILRVAREHILGKPSSPTSSELLEDLTYLQTIHREKVGQLTRVEHNEHFDFCLVLQPQAVYEFWADLLDFRAEQLGQQANEDETSWPQTVQSHDSNGSDESDNDAPTVIDSRPFLTPLTGTRRLRTGRLSSGKQDSSSFVKDQTPVPRTTPMQRRESSASAFPSGIIRDNESGRRVIKSRLSMFERAVGGGSLAASPSMRPSFTTSKRNLYDSPTPNVSEKTPVTTSRHRWGNRNTSNVHGTPDLMSPPVQALLRQRSSLSSRTSTSARSTPLQNDDQVTSTGKRRKCNSIRTEYIPTQVIPRGIASRTNGMMQFLSALKGGIVVRRHRPGAEALFCKIMSPDGGNTIKYQHIEEEEAMLALKEQRGRFNNKRFKNPASPRGVEPKSIDKKWSHKQFTDQSDEVQTFSLPDFIAAKQYREKILKEQVGVSKMVNDLVTKVANSGIVRVADVIAVHPARHKDPRSENGEFGTSALRKSKSEYYIPHTFSLVTRQARRLGKGKLSSTAASEKWHAGEGTDANFKTLDLEAATEGEYWLIFRGFLLLHRDAACGRYAAQRAAGFGSNYTGTAAGTGNEENLLETEPAELVLHKNEFKEPPTVSYMERLVVKLRKIDDSYMEGHVAPDAVPPPSDYFLGFSSPGTQIWSRLRYAGLDTQRIYALDTKRVMIKVRCPADRLTDVAEVLRLKLKTRDGSFAPFRENSLSIYQPLNDDLDTPPSLGAAASLFRSSERQTIIDFIIRSRIRDSGAELGQNTDLGKLIAARVPLHMHGKLDSLYNVWFYFWRPCNWESRDGRSMIVEKCTRSRARTSSSATSNSGSAHLAQDGDDFDDDNRSRDPSQDQHMPSFFFRLIVGSLYQPLDSIEQYFGENVAFYFAWLQHSAFHLAFLSVAGLIVFICQIVSGIWDHWIRPAFAMIIMLWSFIVMVNWRKRSNFLAHRWGTMNYKEQETTRPQFKGEYRKDEITGEWVVYYPSWKRWLKYLISFPITLAFTVGTLVLILLVHANRDQLLARYIALLDASASDSEKFHMDFSVNTIGYSRPVNSVPITRALLMDPTFWFLTAGLPSLLGLCLPLLNFILMRVSIVLNDFENYRTESEYRTHLIIKVFSFRFVCYFATLYYYAFISTGSPQAIENGILRVGIGVFIYVTISHWWGVFLQIFFPLSIRKVRLHFQKKQLCGELKMIELEENQLEASNPAEDDEAANEKRINLVNRRCLLDQGQDEVWEEIMLPMHDSFPEYIQAVILFAYVTCFSVVLPITPFFCLINHLLSMRLDAYKVCRGRRRPLTHKTGGIGVWEHVLHVVTVIAVLTNCWLMGFTNATISSLSKLIGTVGLIAIVVGWEHLMLLIKYVMQTSISPLPKSVREEIQKEEFRIAQKRNHSLQRRNEQRSKQKHQTSTRSSLLDSESQSHLTSKTVTRSSPSRHSTSSTGPSLSSSQTPTELSSSQPPLSASNKSNQRHQKRSTASRAQSYSKPRVESPFENVQVKYEDTKRTMCSMFYSC